MTATTPVALVTGASSGLGKEATLALAAAGFRVIGDQKPKPRYLAGSTAGRVAVLRRIVPARMFDKGIRKLNRMVG